MLISNQLSKAFSEFTRQVFCVAVGCFSGTLAPHFLWNQILLSARGSKQVLWAIISVSLFSGNLKITGAATKLLGRGNTSNVLSQGGEGVGQKWLEGNGKAFSGLFHKAECFNPFFYPVKEPFSPARLGPQINALSGGVAGVADWIRTKWKLLIGVFPVFSWEFSAQQSGEMSTSAISG